MCYNLFEMSDEDKFAEMICYYDELLDCEEDDDEETSREWEEEEFIPDEDLPF